MKNYNISNLLSKPFAGSRQKGASSLEYLMLGAVIVIILGFVIAQTEGGGGIGQLIYDTFEGLFSTAGNSAPE
ncbi:hypothetical protein [Marinobacter excellens]|uniref:hypothetical protein n=1 Tax=Marinobacter excellens TaxID=218670 RepID=UPI000773DCC6|nr:hypothetical protein [Marinobacter excellens]